LKTNPITDYAKLKYNISISNSFRPGLPKMTYKKETWGDSYFIEGKVTRWDKRYKVLRLCVSRPGLLAATLFKEALGKSGIGIDGAIKKGIAPITSKTLLVIKASDLKTICRFLNTESNNVAAELINKDLGATFHSTPGTRQKGLSIIKKFLIERVGLTKDTFQIKDASGLSVKNRFTASQFCQALNTFYSELREVFMETLVPQGYHPHAAYPIPPKEIKIMVKSGTLPSTGVNSVGGYIFLTRFQKALSFVIFTQRIRGSQKAYSGTYTNPLLSSLVNALKELN
jgi:D-alanyl-D-alanine carboxypeptidase